MATEAIILTQFREKLAAHMAGTRTLPVIAFMAFGDGGHDADNEAIPPSESQTALRHEVLRKKLSFLKQEDTLSVTGKGSVEAEELVGVELSEAALVDADGDLIGIKTFAPKKKEADERYDISIKVRF